MPPHSPHLRIVDPAAPCADMPTTLAYNYPYPLDPFQQHAVAAIHRHENVLVTAKTGSGKTLVGEYQIAHSLSKGRRVFYTTPIKSLSNQKFYDLKRMFPDRVGIMTGDIKFKPDADIVIMTTEILRNMLYKQGTTTEALGLTASLSLDRLDAVVFDECHYINDRDRGAVWEETMILLPPAVNLVLLSATIDAPEDFASWLGDLKGKPIHLISTQYRIVPLLHGVMRGDELLTVMDSKDRFEPGLYKAWLLWRRGQADAAAAHRDRVADRRRGGYEDGPVTRGPSGSPKAFVHQMNELIARLESQTLLPALFFVFSRKDCERYAAKVEHTLIDSSDTAAVRHILDFHLHRYGDELLRLPQYNTLRGLLEKGIAFHHSGLLPVLKEIVEILFGRGLIKLLFATETFAVGINMPTKTVVFTSYRKYDDAVGGMRLLNTDEYIQMAGRAGRRGKDDRGVVLYLPDREAEEAEDVKRMMTGRRATFQSRMNFGYEFLLKTLQAANLRWLDLLKDSYWFRRHQRTVEACAKDLEAARVAVAAPGLSEAERAAMEEGEALQQRVKETTNAPRRAAQRALEEWRRTKIGPRWFAVEKELWPAYKRRVAELAALEREWAALQEPGRDVEPTLEAMRAMGLLEPGEAAEGEGLTLTPLGVSATEVNEGHPILMARLADSGQLTSVDNPVELLTVLAAFLGEPGKESAVVDPESLDVPGPVRTALAAIRADAAACARLEAGVRALSPDGFWEVDFGWVEPIYQFLTGTPLPTLAAEYGIYEGNLVRVLLKMGNVLEEWRTLATLRADTEMLNRLAGAEKMLALPIPSSDSLYLRLA
jgi:superfamily II RNA helicase